MENIFLYGTLRHEALLELVAGGRPDLVDAQVRDWRVAAVRGHDYPMFIQASGDVARGLLLRDVTPQMAARMHHYEDAFGYHPHPVTVEGPEGAVTAQVYLPDVAEIYDDAWPLLEGLDCLVIDALRRSPHPTHAHLEKTLEWIEQLQPERAVLTNMHIDLDYATIAAETPDHIEPAHDGLVLHAPL